MTTVRPRPPRWRREKTPTGYRIVIPARRDWVALPFLTAWILVCAAVVVVAALLLAPDSGLVAGGAFGLVPWLAAWGALGLASLYAWLWMVTGREVITLDATTLTVRRAILGIGRSRTYTLADVRNFQIIPWRSPPSIWSSRGGSVLFDYGSDTVRFGVGLSGPEATQLVQAIRDVALQDA